MSNDDDVSSFTESLLNAITTIDQTILDSKWLREELAGLLVFSWFAGMIIWIVARVFDWVFIKRRHSGWKLKVIGFPDQPQKLDWQEVRRFRESDFELWKFVKSIVSGTLFVTPRTWSEVKGRWAWVDEKQKCVVIDFNNIPNDENDNHISRWQSGAALPDGWEKNAEGNVVKKASAPQP